MTENIKAKLIEPTHIEESSWTIVHLPDGSKLKAKHIVIGVMRMFNEKGEPMQLADGSPMYGINFSNPIVGWFPKEEQRKLS